MKPTSRLKLAVTVLAVARASRAPGSPSLAERAACVPRMVRATLDRSYTGTTAARLALVAGAAAYVASPVDLIPESVMPVIGLADDAVVLRWAVQAFVEETDRFLVWEAARHAWRPTWAEGASPWEFARSPRRDRDHTGAATPGESPAGAGAGHAARALLLESVRRRLER